MANFLDSAERKLAYSEKSTHQPLFQAKILFTLGNANIIYFSIIYSYFNFTAKVIDEIHEYFYLLLQVVEIFSPVFCGSFSSGNSIFRCVRIRQIVPWNCRHVGYIYVRGDCQLVSIHKICTDFFHVKQWKELFTMTNNKHMGSDLGYQVFQICSSRSVQHRSKVCVRGKD